MILYEFVCQDCKHEFEELVSMEDSRVVCPHCQSQRVERVLSAVKARSGLPASGLGSDAGCAPAGGFS